MTNGLRILKMKFFSEILRITVSLLLLASLPLSCGGEGKDDGRTPVRIVTWKPDYPQIWDTVLARFHQANPDIRIVREIGPQNSTQLHDLLTQKLRNRDASVDAFLMDVIWTAEFARAGWAAPLDDRFPPEERKQFFAGCIAADVVGDSIYGVPFNTDSGVLFYRTDLLDKHGFGPPRTWPELVDQVDSILAGERDPLLSGYSGQFRQYEGLVCNMLEFVGANGGDLLTPGAPEVMEAVTFVRDRIIAGAAPRGVLTYQEQESLDLFASGGAIFHRNWPYAWAVCRESAVAGNVGIARLPPFKPDMSTAALGGWRFGVSAFSQHPDEAWRVVAFLTSPTVQKLFSVSGGKAPARRALYQDADVLAANPHFAALFDVFETAAPRPRSPIYPELSHILQRFLHAAIADTLSEIPALAHQAAVAIRTAQARVD